jgi:hypothetical protein
MKKILALSLLALLLTSTISAVKKLKTMRSIILLVIAFLFLGFRAAGAATLNQASNAYILPPMAKLFLLSPKRL